MSKALNFKLKNAPKKPGVYKFKDKKEEIIYIGKAKNLFKRVNSYFQKDQQELKVRRLVKKIASVDFMVTDNEIEALILELNLIKKHQPAYNIEYKDDKSYPYIAITSNDEFPRITITREAHKKGAKYFGPYVNVTALRQTVDTLRSIFPLRTCRDTTPGRISHRQVKKGKVTYSPCLNFHIEKCASPCSKRVTVEDYERMVKRVVDFLEGKGKETLAILGKEMKEASLGQQFERAARIRDRLEFAEIILGKQKVASESDDDLDIFGSASKDGYFSVALFMVRRGKLLGSENYEFKVNAETEPQTSFMKCYYHSTSFIPKEVLLAEDIADSSTLKIWLEKIRKGQVEIRVPQRGRKKRLIELASKNAQHNLDFYLKRLQVESERAMKALKQLKDSTGFKMPYRIECFDVSNIAGKVAVGSMVVFENGKPNKSHYRRFKIRYDKGIDDYKMLAEIIGRRLKGLLKSDNDSFKTKPDLILVDGGKGQLSAAKEAIDRYYSDISVGALAKREEELFIPLKSSPINLKKDGSAYRLIQQIRDEAHRFALEYHRNLRSKKMLASVLDNIEGIGNARRKLLLNNFGSVEKIKKLNSKKLAKETGIGKGLSEKIIKSLKQL